MPLSARTPPSAIDDAVGCLSIAALRLLHRMRHQQILSGTMVQYIQYLTRLASTKLFGTLVDSDGDTFNGDQTKKKLTYFVPRYYFNLIFFVKTCR